MKSSGHAAAAQELFGDLPLGPIERVHADAARIEMSVEFQVGGPAS